ncbi:hypothetical protein [Paenibacillus ihuae]
MNPTIKQLNDKTPVILTIKAKKKGSAGFVDFDFL